MPDDVNQHLINKSIIHSGRQNVFFSPGTKVYFHFQARKLNDDKIIDDSRNLGRPMELVLGKSFKLPVWETIVQMMALGEVAKFTVDKSLVSAYPFVSKTWRDANKPQEQRRHHCCGVTLQNEGIGYDDLNELINSPCDMEFILELLKVQAPDEYKKESWQLSEEEKLQAVPNLREEGNTLFKEKDYQGAAQKYAEAIGYLEQLLLSEKPGCEEWMDLVKLKNPLLLNYAQCKLYEKDYYAVIEHCTSVLKYDPDNIKALFRRAKAHVGVWNPTNAHEDFRRVMELDPSLTSAVKKELKTLEDLEKQKYEEDKIKLAGKMF